MIVIGSYELIVSESVTPSSTTIYIRVHSTPLVVKVSDGTTVTSQTGSQVTIDAASLSSDPDENIK